MSELRYENGHTVPSIETLEKWTKALEIPMCQLFYDGEKPSVVKVARENKPSEGVSIG
jgi:transcriptional regulator with XRE-family HTH domain